MASVNMFWILLLSAFGPMYSVFIQTEPDCFKPESSESNLWSHHLYHSYCESGDCNYVDLTWLHKLLSKYVV